MRGKIARLPREIREELNQRLDNGEMANAIVDWLNSLSETQEVVQAHFQGNEITEQNLSEWRQGGFQEWLAKEEVFARVHEFQRDAANLIANTGDKTVADGIAAAVAARYAMLLAKWDGEIDDEFRKKTRALRRLCQDVSKLRRGDAMASRVATDFERFKEMKKTNMERFADAYCAVIKSSKEGKEAFEVLSKFYQQETGETS